MAGEELLGAGKVGIESVSIKVAGVEEDFGGWDEEDLLHAISSLRFMVPVAPGRESRAAGKLGGTDSYMMLDGRALRGDCALEESP